MKKVLTLCMIVLSICTSLSLTAFARDEHSNYCYIKGDFESIDFDGINYFPIDSEDIYLDIDYFAENCIDLEEDFYDETIKKKYYYYDVYYCSEYPYVLCAEFESDDDYWEIYFVKEDRYDEVVSVINGESENGYLTESDYAFEYSFSKEQIDAWLNSKVKEKRTVKKFSDYPLYTTDKGGAIRKEIGLILRDESKDIYYLLYYKDYDRSFFYADGFFALDSDVKATVYLLTDQELSEELTTLYQKLPEDELGWMTGAALPESVFFVLTLIIFGIVPFALIVLSVILILVKKLRNPYFASLVTLIAASAAIIIGYIVILLQLK